MKKLTSKPLYYCAIQLLNAMVLCNVVNTALCQAKVKEEHNLSVEILSDISTPPKTIWATIANTSSATIVDPTHYRLVVTEGFTYEDKKKMVDQITSQSIPLKNLVSSDEWHISEEGKVISFTSKAYKSMNSSLRPLAYFLQCHIEDNQLQKVSNEIENISLPYKYKDIVQEGTYWILDLFVNFTARYVAGNTIEYFHKIYKEDTEGGNKFDFANFIHCHQVLGIAIGASKKDIGNARKGLAMEYHPDKNSKANTTTKMQEINSAADTLIKDIEEYRYTRYSWYSWSLVHLGLKIIPTPPRSSTAPPLLETIAGPGEDSCISSGSRG